MATLDLNSLFGQDPRLLQQSMDLQMAKLSPEERLYMMGAQGGRAIGQGLGSLFGVDVQDPVVKQATQLRALAGEFDTTTAEGLSKFALAASKINPRAGFLAAQQADAIRKQQAETRAKEADIKKTESETLESVQKRNLMIGRVAMLLGSGLSESEATGIASSDSAFSKFVENKDIATPADYAVAASSLGFPVKGKLKDYTPEQMRQMDAKVVENKRELAKAGSTKVTVPLGDVFDKMWNTQDAKAQNEAWDLKGQTYQNIPILRDKLEQVRTAIDSSFTGTGANTKLALSKLSRTLGLPVDVNKASNTEIAEAFTTQFAVAELKKNFGSNPAVKDFEAQLKIKPNIVQEPETMKKLIDGLLKGLDAESYAYNQGEAYKKANKGSMSGFNVYAATNEANAKISRLDALQRKAATGLTQAEKDEAIKLQADLRQWIK